MDGRRTFRIGRSAPAAPLIDVKTLRIPASRLADHHPLLISLPDPHKRYGRDASCRIFIVLMAPATCAGPQLPAPNSAIAVYDARENAIRVTVSSLQPASEAVLIGQDGSRYPAVGFSVISEPHVLTICRPQLGLG